MFANYASNINFHEVCFVDEILSKSYPTISKKVRVTGKLTDYNPITSTGRLSSSDYQSSQFLRLNLKYVENTSFIKGHLYQLIGEISSNEEGILLVKVAKNVDGLDLPMFRKAVNLRRQYLSKLSSTSGAA